MNRNRVATGAGVTLAAVMLVCAAGRVNGMPTAGTLLTNFASATYNLPGGANVKGEEQAGYSPSNWPNSATAWVIITDQPTLCLALRKSAIDCTSNATITSQFPGSSVCFQISFSNCGNYSGYSVMVTDIMPANLTKQNGPPGAVWWQGPGPNSVTTTWATTLLGPWYSTGNAGQVGPMYMRWLLNRVGMHKTGYIRYQATIN